MKYIALTVFCALSCVTLRYDIRSSVGLTSSGTSEFKRKHVASFINSLLRKLMQLNAEADILYFWCVILKCISTKSTSSLSQPVAENVNAEAIRTIYMMDERIAFHFHF